MVAERGSAGRLHAGRIPRQQRAHLAAFLIFFAAGSLFAANDIIFDPATTQADFETFSRIVAQGIFATPVQPARSSGVLGFDVGVAATIVKIDTSASYWTRAVPATNDFTRGGYVAVPRLVASKGFGAGTISASYAKVSDSGIKTYGGALDIPLLRGTVVMPELAIRGSYATISGVDVFKLKTYGLEVFLSKGFGPFMPYAAVGKMRSDARGTITPTLVLTDKSTINRYTAGLRLSLLVPKIVIEATKAEATSYAAKISFGF